MKEKKEPLLLHVCCATCTPYVLKVVSKEFTPTIYFYNPNIHPYDEYLKRRLDIEGYIRSLNLEFIEGEYDADRWCYMTQGLEHEPEGALRCEICFKMRLNEVARYAARNGFTWFATTLTVSPHKNSRVINRIGRELAEDYGIQFYRADFKKNDGFKLSLKMAKTLDFYRQSYCGCFHSRKEASERKHLSEEISRQTQQMVSPTNLIP